MDEAQLILTALSSGAGAVGAGAVAGLTEGAKSTVADLVARLRAGLAAKLAGRPVAQAAAEAYPRDEADGRQVLAGALADSGAAADEVIVATARQILVLVDPAGASAGRYDLRGAQGVQVNESGGGVQVNNF
jgi:hypothetical protein